MCLCVSHRPLTNEMPFFIVIIIDYLILRRWSERKKRSEKKCFSSIGSLWMIAFVAFQIVFKGYWSTMKYGKSNWEKYRKRKKKLPENICVHTIIWMVIRICGFFLVIVCVCVSVFSCVNNRMSEIKKRIYLKHTWNWTELQKKAVLRFFIQCGTNCVSNLWHTYIWEVYVRDDISSFFYDQLENGKYVQMIIIYESQPTNSLTKLKSQKKDK